MATIQTGIPSLITGDFTYIETPNKKRAGKPFSSNKIEVRELKNFVFTNGLHDLEFISPMYA